MVQLKEAEEECMPMLIISKTKSIIDKIRLKIHVN